MIIAQISDTHIELVRPSFVLHKWTGGYKLVSEVVQTLEAENRLLPSRIANNEMD